MHVPDHLISNGVELAAGVTAAAVIASVAFDVRRRGNADDGPILLRSPERIAPQAAPGPPIALALASRPPPNWHGLPPALPASFCRPAPIASSPGTST